MGSVEIYYYMVILFWINWGKCHILSWLTKMMYTWTFLENISYMWTFHKKMYNLEWYWILYIISPLQINNNNLGTL